MKKAPTNEARTIRIATRGSALALAQANEVAALCRDLFPGWACKLKIFKTTGDKLQTASLAQPGALPKGLFTKELEMALLDGVADIAVHSLKDLPTELPAGLELGAVLKRADARDVLVTRVSSANKRSSRGGNVAADRLRRGATVATSSPRRKAQLLSRRPDLNVVEIRGNVGTRLRKLAESTTLDGTLLAAAGLHRLGFRIGADAQLSGDEVPDGLAAFELEFEEMIPCVGQAAIGLEILGSDEFSANVCAALNDEITHRCVSAERAFLRAMGGGCQSPVAAIGTLQGQRLELRGVSFQGQGVRHGLVIAAFSDPELAGKMLAGVLASEA